MSPTFVDGVDSVVAAIDDINVHLSSRERWFGKSADQSGNDWALESSLTVFRAISGSGAFGADANDEAKVFGSADTPNRTGMNYFDIHRLTISAVSVATDTVIRIIWGTGTMAAGESAGQYTDMMATDAKKGGPIEVNMRHVASGSKMWVRIKNATDNATFDFFVGMHEHVNAL